MALVVLLCVIEYQHYDLEKARGERDAEVWTFVQRVALEYDVSIRERKLSDQRMENLMKQLDNIEKKLRVNDIR